MHTRRVTRRYLVVWGWLLLLMALSLVAAASPVARPAVAALMFVVALAKAVLVVLNFMHLRVEGWLVHALVIVPALLVAGLIVALVPDFVLHR